MSWDIALLWMSCQQQAKCRGDFLARHFLAGVFEFKPIFFFFSPSVCSCSMSLTRKVKIVLCICKILLSADPLPHICSTVWEVGVAVNNLQSRPVVVSLPNSIPVNATEKMTLKWKSFTFSSENQPQIHHFVAPSALLCCTRGESGCQFTTVCFSSHTYI